MTTLPIQNAEIVTTMYISLHLPNSVIAFAVPFIRDGLWYLASATICFHR